MDEGFGGRVVLDRVIGRVREQHAVGVDVRLVARIAEGDALVRQHVRQELPVREPQQVSARHGARADLRHVPVVEQLGFVKVVPDEPREEQADVRGAVLRGLAGLGGRLHVVLSVVVLDRGQVRWHTQRFDMWRPPVARRPNPVLVAHDHPAVDATCRLLVPSTRQLEVQRRVTDGCPDAGRTAVEGRRGEPGVEVHEPQLQAGRQRERFDLRSDPLDHRGVHLERKPAGRERSTEAASPSQGLVEEAQRLGVAANLECDDGHGHGSIPTVDMSWPLCVRTAPRARRPRAVPTWG